MPSIWSLWVKLLFYLDKWTVLSCDLKEEMELIIGVEEQESNRTGNKKSNLLDSVMWDHLSISYGKYLYHIFITTYLFANTLTKFTWPISVSPLIWEEANFTRGKKPRVIFSPYMQWISFIKFSNETGISFYFVIQGLMKLMLAVNNEYNYFYLLWSVLLLPHIKLCICREPRDCFPNDDRVFSLPGAHWIG